MSGRALVLVLALVAAGATAARAQPGVPDDPAIALREANEAATAGDWPRVGQLAQTVLARHPGPAELAECHRLAGLAAFFESHRDVAESEFLAYLRLDPDGHLDPALVPPDAVAFLDGVRARHAAELRALRPRPRPRRYLSLAFVPPLGQFQNGERVKGFVLLGMFSTLAAADLTSVGLLGAWCTHVAGPAGSSLECEPRHVHAAQLAREVEIATTAALIATYVYGVYDGVTEYHRRSATTLAPYASPRDDGAVLGVIGRF